jgi:hypothetical protein
MDVWFCIGRNLRREAQIALEGILIRSNARSPKRARKTRAFRLTLNMEVGYQPLELEHVSKHRPTCSYLFAASTPNRPAPPGALSCLLIRECAYFASCLSMKSAMMWLASMDSGRDASYQNA